LNPVAARLEQHLRKLRALRGEGARAPARLEELKRWQAGRLKLRRCWSKNSTTGLSLNGVTSGLALATGLIAAIAVDWGPRGLSGADTGKRGPKVRPYFTWSNGPSLGARGSF